MTGTKRTTEDLKRPVKTNGTLDKRYHYPQFVNQDGKRDKRTTVSSQRK
jgi:hypothetical protein